MTMTSAFDTEITWASGDYISFVDVSDNAVIPSGRNKKILIDNFMQAYAPIEQLYSFDVKKWGAVGDGVTDDTDAFNDAVDWIQNTNGGGQLYISAGLYKISDTIRIPPGMNPISAVSGLPTLGFGGGVGIRGDGPWSSRISAVGASMWGKPVFMCGREQGDAWSGSGVFRDFGITGPSSQSGEACTAFGLGTNPQDEAVLLMLYSLNYSLISNVDLFGGGVGLAVSRCDGTLIDKVHAREARQANGWLVGPMISPSIINSLFQVANSAGIADPTEEVANLKVTNNQNVGFQDQNHVKNLFIAGTLFDETGLGFLGGGADLYLKNATNTTVERSECYAPGKKQLGGAEYYGIRVGAACVRTTLRDIRVEPYAVDGLRVPDATIKIDIGATDTVMENISTDPNYAAGGVDILDGGTRTVWRNVNGIYAHSQNPVFATPFAPLVSAGPDVFVGALTGNIVISGPDYSNLSFKPGMRLTLFFTQDATGGRTVTWNAIYKHGWSDVGNTANKRSSISFIINSVGDWIQDGPQKPWM